LEYFDHRQVIEIRKANYIEVPLQSRGYKCTSSTWL